MNSYKVFLYPSTTPLDLDKCKINSDDTINVVLKKLSFVLKTPWTSLYAWYYKTTHPEQLSGFMNQCMRSKKTIDFKDLKKAFQNHFGKPLKVPSDISYNMLDYEEALSVVKKQKILASIEPLSFRYMNEEFMEFLNYDPSRQQDIEALDITPFTITNFLSMTLRSCEILNNEIHVIKYDATKPHLFPLYTSSESKQLEILANTNKLIKDLIDLEESINNVYTSEYSSQGYINFIHLHTSPSMNTNPLLSRIFNLLHTTVDKPFIKLKVKTNVFYKIHEDYVEPLLENKELFKKLTAVSTQQIEYILIKFQFAPLSSATVILKQDGSYDLRMHFSIKSRETRESVLNYLKIINRYLASINQIARTSLLQVPANIFETKYDNVIVDRIVMHGIVGSKTSQVKFKNFVSLVKSKFYPYFEVIPTEDKHSLILQYKKIDNYTQYDNIKAFITRYYSLGKEELLEKIVQNFSITTEEAQEEYNKWISTNEVELVQNGAKRFFKPKYDSFVNIIIRLNNIQDMKFMVSGNKDMMTFENIAELMKKLCKMSLSKHKEKSSEYLNLFEQHVVSLDEQPQKPSTFADIDEEDLQDPESDEFDEDEDDDLKQLEKEFAMEMEEDTLPPPPPPPPSDEKKKKSKGELLNKLREADRTLFDYKADKTLKRTDYASMCGAVAQRQPVVVSKEELDVIEKKHKGAIHGHVKTGSTPDLAKKNFYICPNIWCPKSRIAITYETYKDAGFKCPNPDIDEEPYLFVKEDDKTQPGLDKKLSRPHYPSFLDMYTHPDKLCLPCCFLTPPKEGSRNQQRQGTCVSNHQDENASPSKPVINEDQQQIMGNEKYIKGESYSPLESSRYGLLVKEVHNLFGSGPCGDRHDGTGIMKEKYSCYLRRGIEHKNQSFMSAVSYILDASKGSETVKRRILKYLTLQRYMSLENGRLLKLFIDTSKNIYDPEHYKAFQKFMQGQPEYAARFNIKNVSSDTQGLKDVLREFIIWSSYTNFLAYIKNDDYQKDHHTLLDLINMGESYLNPDKIVFAIIEIDANAKAYIQCPVRGVEKLDQIAFIVKRGQYYEPLVFVENVPKKGLLEQKVFPMDATISPKFKTLLEFFIKNCKLKEDIKNKKNCKAYLESKGYSSRCMVIDYDFKICGIILKNNLYIPLFERLDIFDHPKERYVYFNEVPLYKCVIAQTEIKTIYKLVEKYTKDSRYQIKYWIKDKTGFVINDNDMFIPLNLKSTTKTFQTFSDDLNIFVGESNENQKRLIKLIEETLNKHPLAKQEITFLLDRGNPLPEDFKKSKLEQILKSISITVDTETLTALKKSLHVYVNPASMQFKAHDNEYLLTYRDIRANKLNKLLEIKKNPFKFVTDALDNMNVAVYDFNSSNPSTPNLLDEVEFEEVPTKYRKFMKEFKVAKVKSYDRLWLLDLFCQLSSGKLDMEIFESTIQKQIMEDFIAHKDMLIKEFQENPCYENIWKKDQRYQMLDSFIESQKMLSYFPSFYEAAIGARLLNVNMVIFGHKTLNNPDGLHVYMGQSDADDAPYLLLKHSFNRFDKRDEFAVFVKNEKVILLKNSDLPQELQEIIKLKSQGEFEIDMPIPKKK